MGKLNNSLVLSDNQILKQKGYTVNALLGEGSFSTVKSAIWKKAGSTETLHVAIKIINKATAPKDFLEKFLPRETEVMKKIKHENIIQLYDIFSEGNKIYMSLEKAGHGDLLDYILLKKTLNMSETRKIFFELVLGIGYLHNNQIIHRDLKCENILLSKNNKIKIADFGFAKLMEDASLSETFCGSAAYASPEVITGIPYKPHVPDIWSLGVILYIMVSGIMPFSDISINRLTKDQQKPCLDFPEGIHIDDDYSDLVNGLLRYNLRQRIKSITSITSHKWMKGPQTLSSGQKTASFPDEDSTPQKTSSS